MFVCVCVFVQHDYLTSKFELQLMLEKIVLCLMDCMSSVNCVLEDQLVCKRIKAVI